MKRVLIISNHCLSERNSNGRTLSNMLLGYPKEDIAQFCLMGDSPDFSRCERYFLVSDNDALNALLRFRKVGRKLTPEPKTAGVAASKKKSRNAITMLMREFIWRTGAWKRGGFTQFVEEFQPEVVLLQAGDCAFMLRLARKLAERYRIPLVIYNSEGYYFKDYDYFCSTRVSRLFYPLFRHYLRKQFRKMMRCASRAVYSCEELENAYREEFTCPAETIYTATQMRPVEKRQEGILNAAYLGNLGVGREDGLIEIAQALRSIDEGARLHLYGRMPNETVRKKLEACSSIECHGFVSYDEVRRAMREAALLVHTENFSAYYREDLKFAFSTKIADSLASGSCFLLYAPPELAATRYLTKEQCAYVATDAAQLKTTLQLLAEQPKERARYLEHAAQIVQKNHCAETNAARFREILNSSY